MPSVFRSEKLSICLMWLSIGTLIKPGKALAATIHRSFTTLCWPRVSKLWVNLILCLSVIEVVLSNTLSLIMSSFWPIIFTQEVWMRSWWRILAVRRTYPFSFATYRVKAKRFYPNPQFSGCCVVYMWPRKYKTTRKSSLFTTKIHSIRQTLFRQKMYICCTRLDVPTEAGIRQLSILALNSRPVNLIFFRVFKILTQFVIFNILLWVTGYDACIFRISFQYKKMYLFVYVYMYLWFS